MLEGEVWELRQAADALLTSLGTDGPDEAVERLQRAVDAMNYSEAVEKARLRESAA